MVAGWGACMIAGGGSAWLLAGAGGMRGCWWGVCMVAGGGGVHGCWLGRNAWLLVGGHAWCMVAGGGGGVWLPGGMRRIRQDTVNERVVRILVLNRYSAS